MDLVVCGVIILVMEIKKLRKLLKSKLKQWITVVHFQNQLKPAAELASVLSELSPGDLNTVFFTPDGSTANETALRFVMLYNNILGRPEKKHIISRDRSYHGSYLSHSFHHRKR